ncbi:MAG: preprotein translocase subunit SecG [Thermodesulfobacteriota bacterium]
MTVLIVIVHVFVCLALILIVLLQTGKGADMGASFGGSGSQTLFGASGAMTFLNKATTVVAVVFMATCLMLAYISTNRTPSSIMKETKVPIEESAAKPETADMPQPAAEPLPAPAAETAPEKTE